MSLDTLDETSARSGIAGAADVGTFERLEALRERALSLAQAILGERDRAQDVVQNAILSLHERGGGTPAEVRPALLFCAVQHAAVDLLRRERALLRREHRAAAGRAQSSHECPVQTLERQEQAAILREELARLPDEAAQPLLLHHLGGLSVREVAAALGISESACKQRLVRARGELRRRLEERELSVASLAGLFGMLCAADGAFAPAGWVVQAERPARPMLLKMALVAVLAGFAGWVALGTFAPPRSPAANETGGAQAPARSEPAARAVLGWQAPRFSAANDQPLAVSVSGRHAAVLARAEDKSLLLLRTANAGDTWTRQALAHLPPTTEDLSIEMEPDGTLRALAFRERQGGLSRGVDWITISADGTASPPVELWNCTGENQGFLSARVIQTESAHWLFGLRYDRTDPKRGVRQIEIARALKGEAPKRVACEIEGPVMAIHLPVWAKDAEHAGFVVARGGRNATPQGVHFTTNDGGATWEQIPLTPPEAADSASRGLELPETLLRTGDALTLLCWDRDCYALNSTDLGRTWGKANLVQSIGLNDLTRNGSSHLAAAHGSRFALMAGVAARHHASEGVQPNAAIAIGLSLLQSSDGRTWNARPEISQAARNGYESGILGGDEQSVHVVLRHSGGRGLLFQSFTRAAWKPAADAPAWTREKKKEDETW